MKKTTKKSSKKLLYLSTLATLVLVAIAGGIYYHHYEYDPVMYHFPDGSSASISRHNLNQMTPAVRDAFLHPVNETILHPCTGNMQDQCIENESVDLWPTASTHRQLTLTPGQQSGPLNEIMGRITDDSTNILSLKTTSGRTISITFPTNIINDFNANRAASYGFTIGTGDEIYVNYSGAMGPGNTINTDQITQAVLLIKGNAKTGPVSKY